MIPYLYKNTFLTSRTKLSKVSYKKIQASNSKRPRQAVQEDVHDDRDPHILFWYARQEISFQWEDVIQSSGYTDPIFCEGEREKYPGVVNEPRVSFDVLHL